MTNKEIDKTLEVIFNQMEKTSFPESLKLSAYIIIAKMLGEIAKRMPEPKQ